MERDDLSNINEPNEVHNEPRARSASNQSPDPQDDPLDGENPALGENSPDEILETDRERGDEYAGQIQREPAGDNLEHQSPTQEQTSGEDDVGGFSDEEYDEAGKNEEEDEGNDL